MIRSPSEPSPFATVRCPFDTQANCRRPYCPFAHRPDEDDVVEDSENDVVLLEDEELADDDDDAELAGDDDEAQSSSPPPLVTTPTTTTEIRQENPTDLFSGGGYVGYVSQNHQNSNFPMIVPSSHHQNLQQPPPQQQQQQGHIFFPNLPPNHQHQPTLVFPSFQPSAAMPPYAAAVAPPSHFITHTHPQQYANAMMYAQPPMATVSSAHQFPPIQPAAIQGQQGPSTVAASKHKRPKPTPGGLPSYIPTPIVQLEKEQREREERKEQRRAKHGGEHNSKKKRAEEEEKKKEEKEQGEQQHKGSAEKGKEKEQNGKGRESGKDAERRGTATKERKASVSADDGGGLDIDRIMDGQKQLLDEIADDPEKKMREILRVEAEHERRLRLAKQKANNKKFVSLKQTIGAKTPSKLATKIGSKLKKIEKKKTSPKKKKLTSTEVKKAEKKERHTVIKSLIDDEQKKRQREEMDKKKKQEDEAKTAKKKFTSEVNDCVKNVAQLDMRIQKIQSEMRRSNNKLAMMDIGKSSTTSTNSSSKVVGTNSLTSTAAVAPAAAAVVVDKEGAAEKTTPSTAKKVPVWRKDSDHTSKPSSFLEDNRFYLASQRHPIPAALRRNGTTSKSLDTDPIICELFGDDDVEEENAMIGTKKRRRKQSVDEVLPNTKICPLGGSSTTNAMIKREKKRLKREEPNGDDECLRKERQAMVDSILEDESEKDEAAAAAAEETGPKSVLSAAFIKRGKRPLSRSPSIVSIQSSVSVVPETPPTSPRPATDRLQVLPQATNAATAAMLAQQPQQQRRVPSAEEQLHTRTVAALLASQQQTVANAVDMEWLTKPKEKSKKSSSSTLNNALRQPAPTVAAVSTTSAVAANNNYVPARVPMHHASQRPLAPKLAHAVLSSPTGPSSSAAPKQQHNTTTSSSTVPKGGVRKAHVPRFQGTNSTTAPSLAKSLVPLEPQNRKVPLQIRQRHLATIHAEYVKICGDDPTSAVDWAQNEEKAVLERCNGKLGYLAAIPMLIKRLREAAADGHHHQFHGGEMRRKMSAGDSVSHSSVLLGRHANTVTCGLHRAGRASSFHKTTNLSELDFYNALQAEYLLSEQQLWDNGYPRWASADDEVEEKEIDFDEPSVDDAAAASGIRRLVLIRQSDLDAGKSRIPFVDDSVLSRVCDRCGKEYRLTKGGEYAPGSSADQCIFHWGRAWKKRVSGTIESRYNCCDQPLTVQGCDVAPNHITQTQRLSTLRRYVETPRPFGVGDPRSKKVYALDCEMVYTVWGPEVARLSVVDITGELILDVIIRPEHRIVDCNTKFSGLNTDQVMAGECDLHEAQQRLFELVNTETVLVGHSLESDLRSMRLVHRRVVDTSVVYPHRMGPPYKRALKTLAAEIMQLIIQDDESGHDSKEDALACMRIMLRKVKGAA
ncbi:hypothetical protein GPALN_014135 [Globodera pallida]|nr:hypothetical protein GPALN_014135 [Globodera pallida]